MMNSVPSRPHSILLAAAMALLCAPAAAQSPVSEMQYDVVFNAETAARREIHVEASFAVSAPSPMELSLPAWTPGSYELDHYAQNVRNFWARQDGAEIRWEKSDFDTWRVYPTGGGTITVGFDYVADALDTGSSWARADFAFFNGTNLFLYPEGSDLDFESLVTFHTEPDWSVSTGLNALSRQEYRAADYHELVDMPTFVGRFDADSTQIGDRWYHLASYPSGTLAGQNRSMLWDQIRRMMPPMEAVFETVPWDDYTTLLVFDAGFGGGTALEHANSHIGIYNPAFLGSPVLALITAHEIFHGWNVKRLRPAELWPYAYDRPMPTELLWISEGITDYYADLALVRGGIVSNDFFYGETAAKIDNVFSVPPVALEDASLSTWISPRDGTASVYYPKGSLAGLMVDILIRDATDNGASLDDVMGDLYREAYQAGRGFTEAEWWGAVQEAAGGRSFETFHQAYIDGREPYPWDEILPLVGLRLQTETGRVPRLGISTGAEEQGVVVLDVVSGGAAMAAGVAVDDRLVSVGGIEVEDNGFGVRFREQFAGAETGMEFDIVVERGGQTLTLPAVLSFAEVTASTIVEDPAASERAVRLRQGILMGRTEP